MSYSSAEDVSYYLTVLCHGGLTLLLKRSAEITLADINGHVMLNHCFPIILSDTHQMHFISNWSPREKCSLSAVCSDI